MSLRPHRRRGRAATCAAVVTLVVMAGLAGAARADEAAQEHLGKLEQESVDEARGALGLEVEPAPAGKTIGTIYVVNQDVFSRRDWLFQWFNIFHRTTRENILRRELLIKPGRPYDQALVDESMRNLQSPPTVVIATGQQLSPPELSSVVAIVPVRSATPGMVDVLAVTRDVWSLRFNTNFEFQQNVLTLLDTSLSENNLFGWRKYLSLGFTLDLGKYALGPTYFDPNILGTRLQLYVDADAFFTRGTNAYEGNVETASLIYPLYSLASRWGGGVTFMHEDEIFRVFQGQALTRVPLMTDPTVLVPYIFRRQFVIVDASATRSFGTAVIQRATLGYRYDDRHSLAVAEADYAGATPAQIDAFVSQYAPTTERRSEPYVGYSMFTASYGVFRDLNTFDLRENAQLGPSLSLIAAYGAPELGADFRAFPLQASAAWAIGHGDLYARASATASTRVREGSAIDQYLQGKLFFATPLYGRVLRIVVEGETDAVRKDTRHTLFFLGGDTGLRGYVTSEFAGTTSVVGHVELRSGPLAIWSQRVGGILFCDAGDAAATYSDLVARVDVGLGLRWLIPQLNSTPIRVDWAVPLRDGTVTRAGFPGRVSAGFKQIF
jgi:hypothetical protein